MIETLVASEFFQSTTPANIRVIGSVSLQFVGGGQMLASVQIRSSMVEDESEEEIVLRSLQSSGTVTTSSFSVDVPVEESGGSAMSVGALVGRVVAAVVVVVVVVVTLVAVCRSKTKIGDETLELTKENEFDGLVEETEARDALPTTARTE